MNTEICNLIFKILHTSKLKHNKDHALNTIDVEQTKVHRTISKTIITWEMREGNQKVIVVGFFKHFEIISAAIHIKRKARLLFHNPLIVI